MRIPESLVAPATSQLASYARAPHVPATQVDAEATSLGARKFTLKLAAGSPIVGDDRADERCDLNQWLVRSPDSTFIYTVSGDSMDLAGILDGDQVVVDRELPARSGDIVVAALAAHGHTIKRLRIQGGHPTLEPESANTSHRAYNVDPSEGDIIWGVVTAVVRQIARTSLRMPR